MPVSGYSGQQQQMRVAAAAAAAKYGFMQGGLLLNMVLAWLNVFLSPTALQRQAHHTVNMASTFCPLPAAQACAGQ
jgi:hypothetical protein